jgi:hypothetical protein
VARAAFSRAWVQQGKLRTFAHACATRYWQHAPDGTQTSNVHAISVGDTDTVHAISVGGTDTVHAISVGDTDTVHAISVGDTDTTPLACTRHVDLRSGAA